MSDPVEKTFYYAARDGLVSEVTSLLRDHPEINVNWTNPHCEEWAALHVASLFGHVEVIKLLLAHPKINVNSKNIDGQTPLSFGCQVGYVSVVEELLKDPHVDVTHDDNMGRTPLWYASREGEHEVIEQLIASGRDLGDVKNKKEKENMHRVYTALEIAREKNQTEVVFVLERFLANPTQTGHEVRVKIGVLDALAAEIFALTVFLCDDLLQLKSASHPAAATRFFAMTKRLPMELQMLICHRAVGSTKQNILRKDSEVAFKSLARVLLLLALSERH